ncbi:hypothetical protein D3C87_1237450 [compost metagenome]
MPAIHVPLFPCRLHKRKQLARARIHRMKAMAKAGNERPGIQHPTHLLRGGLRQVRPLVQGRSHTLIKLQASLPGAAMHIAQYIDGRGHGPVHADAAGAGHAGDRDGRRMRTVIHAGHQGRFEQARMGRLGQLTAQHQPDHGGKADFADQRLDGITARANHARLDIDHRSAPPVRQQPGRYRCISTIGHGGQPSTNGLSRRGDGVIHTLLTCMYSLMASTPPSRPMPLRL